LKSVDVVASIGDDPQKSLAEYCDALGERPPRIPPPADQQEHKAIVWWRGRGRHPEWIRRIAPKGDHYRHRHTYLDGDMDEHLRFYFRGPSGELNLPAQNLRIFKQISEGIDDETWLFHLRQGDYSRWFRDVIHDADLARVAEELERGNNLSPRQSRERIFDLIHERYETKVCKV
jgi:hypothetical protein